MMTDPAPNMTARLSQQLDVQQRLRDLARWQAHYRTEDARLRQRVHSLNPDKPLAAQIGAQIAIQRRQQRLQLVQHPLEIDPLVVKEHGYADLQRHLMNQFAALSPVQQQLWLHNFLFIMTPALRQLDDKIVRVRRHLQLGQQRNFLLGGASGSGKTTYLDFLAFRSRPVVHDTYNHVPIIKIDAPVSNHTPKPLLQRMILACGLNYLVRDNEEDLLMKIALYFQQCHVELLIVDEVEQLRQPSIRRRLLEVSNLSTGVPIICAACSPQHFTHGDREIAGRWNDYFHLPQYTGDALRQLLAFINLLLPFPKSSHLDVYQLPDRTGNTSPVDGPAKLIESYTGGILRDIMILITDASQRAIQVGASHLTPQQLETSWKALQTEQVTDVLGLLRQQESAS